MPSPFLVVGNERLESLDLLESTTGLDVAGRVARTPGCAMLLLFLFRRHAIRRVADGDSSAIAQTCLFRYFAMIAGLCRYSFCQCGSDRLELGQWNGVGVRIKCRHLRKGMLA